MSRTYPKYNGELKLARDAKRAGVTREDYLETRTRAYSRSATAQGWPASVLAMSLADVSMAADEVYGKEVQRA